MDTGDADAVADVRPEVITPKAQAPLQGVTNVNLEQEIGDLVKNSSKYKRYAVLVKKVGSHKRMAIDDTF